jgi:hypothetical protein
MKTALPTLSIALLLAVASGMVLANPGQRAWREELRAMQQQPQQEQPVQEARAEKRAPIPRNGNAEEPKKQGKMSVEERRALRRQINEAGRDIYTPGR